MTNKKPTRCHLLLLFYFLETQYVSGINILIFRSLRLLGCWTTTVAISFLICYVLELGCGSARVVSGLPAAWIPKLQHTSNQEQYGQCSNSTDYPQAPDDGYINFRNMLST